MQRGVLLFAKRPRAGRVKTRLVPPLDAGQALRLYRAFLTDQVRFLRALASDSTAVELCADGPLEPDPELDPLLAGVRVGLQGPGDLGRRLLRALRRCRAGGWGPTVVLGVDSPTLPGRLVHEAFRRLDDGADAVVSPARDGGYALVGVRRPRAELFRDVPWGGDSVLAVTRRRAAAAGLALAEVEPWYDVDDERGLAALRLELEDPAARERAPATACCLDALFPRGPGDARPRRRRRP